MLFLDNLKTYEYSEVIESGQDGEVVYVNPVRSNLGITFTVIPGSGSGRIFISTSSRAKVVAGNAVWQPWPHGVVTEITNDSPRSTITAFKGNSVSGQIEIEAAW